MVDPLITKLLEDFDDRNVPPLYFQIRQEIFPDWEIYGLDIRLEFLYALMFRIFSEDQQETFLPREIQIFEELKNGRLGYGNFLRYLSFGLNPKYFKEIMPERMENLGYLYGKISDFFICEAFCHVDSDQQPINHDSKKNEKDFLKLLKKDNLAQIKKNIDTFSKFFDDYELILPLDMDKKSVHVRVSFVILVLCLFDDNEFFLKKEDYSYFDVNIRWINDTQMVFEYQYLNETFCLKVDESMKQLFKFIKDPGSCNYPFSINGENELQHLLLFLAFLSLNNSNRFEMIADILNDKNISDIGKLNFVLYLERKVLKTKNLLIHALNTDSDSILRMSKENVTNLFDIPDFKKEIQGIMVKKFCQTSNLELFTYDWICEVFPGDLLEYVNTSDFKRKLLEYCVMNDLLDYVSFSQEEITKMLLEDIEILIKCSDFHVFSNFCDLIKDFDSIDFKEIFIRLLEEENIAFAKKIYEISKSAKSVSSSSERVSFFEFSFDDLVLMYSSHLICELSSSGNHFNCDLELQEIYEMDSDTVNITFCLDEDAKNKEINECSDKRSDRRFDENFDDNMIYFIKKLMENLLKLKAYLQNQNKQYSSVVLRKMEKQESVSCYPEEINPAKMEKPQSLFEYPEEEVNSAKMEKQEYKSKRSVYGIGKEDYEKQIEIELSKSTSKNKNKIHSVSVQNKKEEWIKKNFYELKEIRQNFFGNEKITDRKVLQKFCKILIDQNNFGNKEKFDKLFHISSSNQYFCKFDQIESEDDFIYVLPYLVYGKKYRFTENHILMLQNIFQTILKEKQHYSDYFARYFICKIPTFEKKDYCCSVFHILCLENEDFRQSEFWKAIIQIRDFFKNNGNEEPFMQVLKDCFTMKKNYLLGYSPMDTLRREMKSHLEFELNVESNETFCFLM
eukprot:TRINITY_DN355_c0_g1_i1.p1 TRINITY_DN355_c0_g1~~TRINITY_DN355_c0_g1_i1.p1  ORF type:complete len:904 (+),score=207.43 TRINITY_DN355_c0_g1_i1:90-2801(+)